MIFFMLTHWKSSLKLQNIINHPTYKSYSLDLEPRSLKKGLALNYGETNVLQFYNRKRPNYLHLPKINGYGLGTNHITKYLGLTIIKNLNWGQHVENITRRLWVVCCLVKRLRYAVDREVFLNIYFDCFQSVRAYGVLFRGNITESFYLRCE